MRCRLYQGVVQTETIREAITQGKWDKRSVNVKAVKDELSVCDRDVLQGSRIMIPRSLRGKVIQLAHEGHRGLLSISSS